MSSVLLAAHDVLHHVLADGTGDYQPNTKSVPQGLKDKVNILLGFLSWTVTALCVAGVMIVGGKMAISHRRGEGGEHAAGLAWVAAGCILIGSAAALVGAII